MIKICAYPNYFQFLTFNCILLFLLYMDIPNKVKNFYKDELDSIQIGFFRRLIDKFFSNEFIIELLFMINAVFMMMTIAYKPI